MSDRRRTLHDSQREQQLSKLVDNVTIKKYQNGESIFELTISVSR
jgi:hypothetical protein